MGTKEGASPAEAVLRVTHTFQDKMLQDTWVLAHEQPLRLPDQALPLLQPHVPTQQKNPLNPSGIIFLTPEINTFSSSKLLVLQDAPSLHSPAEGRDKVTPLLPTP